MASKKKINLLPGDNFDYSTSGKLIKWIASVGRWIVVLTEFIVICALLSRFYFDTKLSDLFDEMKQKQAIVDSALSFEENFLEVQEKTKIVKSLLDNENSYSAVVVDISRRLPLDVTLTQVEFSQQSLNLAGYSLSDNGLRVFLSNLITYTNLKDVSLVKISTPKEDVQGTEFNISASLKK